MRSPPPEAAAAGLSGAARLGIFANLPLPCCAARYARPSDRHRPVQIRRIQAQRIYQDNAQSGLLEEGPTLSRRHRVYGYTQPVDDNIGLYRRQLRPDIRRQRDGPADEGSEEPDA